MKKALENFTQAHFLFAAIALILGLVFIHIIPASWGVDEQLHLSRAYQISQGTLRETKLHDIGGYGGRLPIELKMLGVAVSKDLNDNSGFDHKQVDDEKVYSRLKQIHLSGIQVEQDFTGSGIYFPGAYAAPAAGILIASLLHPTLGGVIFGARLGTLLLYLALVFISLYILRFSNAKWLIFAVALLPMSLFQASIVNVDSYAIGLCLFLLSQLIYIWNQKDKASYLQLAVLAATGGLLTLSKPNYFFLALSICLIPSRVLTKTQQIYARIILALVIILPALLWNYSIHSLVTSGGASQHPGLHVSAQEQLGFIIGHPFKYMGVLFSNMLNNGWYSQSIGLLGHNFIIVRDYVIYFETVILAIAVFFARTRQNTKKGIILIVLGFLSLSSIVTTLYLVYNSVGNLNVEGIQGRYFIPILPFIAYGLSLAIPIKVIMTEKFARYFFASASLICLISSAAYYSFRTG